jgi:hypothetical protein
MQKKTLQVQVDAVRYVVVLPLIRDKLIYERSKRESIQQHTIENSQKENEQASR